MVLFIYLESNIKKKKSDFMIIMIKIFKKFLKIIIN